MHIAGSALLKEAQPVGKDFSKWQLVRNLTLKEVKSNCQDRHFALKGKKAVLCLMFCETLAGHTCRFFSSLFVLFDNRSLFLQRIGSADK